MSPSLRYWKEIILWLGPCLLLVTSFFHTGSEGSTTVIGALSPHAVKWLWIHIVQVFVFGLMALSLLLLTPKDGSVISSVVYFCAFLFGILYIAADAVAGIATGVVLNIYALEPSLDFVAIEGILYSLLESDITRDLFFVASLSWLIATCALALALLRKKESWLVSASLVCAGIALFLGHGLVRGSVTSIAMMVVASVYTPWKRHEEHPVRMIR